VNREERLRRELPDGLKDRAAELAALPAAHVELIARALRATHRAGREHEKQVRRQRRTDRRKYNHIEDPDYAAASVRILDGLGRRAGSNPDALAGLNRFIEKDGPAVRAMAVDMLRAQGYSWADIGAVLGTTRQSAWERFGRQGDPDTGHAAGTPGGAGPPPDPPPAQTGQSGTGLPAVPHGQD
jgi:hypothetical protein